MISDFASWLKSIIEQVASWLANLVISVFSWFVDATIYLIDLMGVTQRLKLASAYFDALPDGVWYFMNLFQVQWGLSLVLASYCVRFLIRRLPVIG
ncbi:DUF2523 domain-containing protein [Pseudomonas asiatica]|uniref:DUF2523 domain-containing protein n=1 Tax=Pseudomonas asiatica TaxID=2219225 RepID=UPI0018D8B1E0|nr:DUF2523 domain-containing protein [Pseudomonas asiatica]MBH3382255.1 DUF2523 domain-containing protein [Pseudomonas asiatica]